MYLTTDNDVCSEWVIWGKAVFMVSGCFPFFLSSIQPISELPVLTSSFQGLHRASAISDIYLNRSCVFLGLGMKSAQEVNTGIILLTHFAAALMGYENKTVFG